MKSATEVQTQERLDWVDAPLAALMRLAWPIIVSMLSFSVMTLVDTLMVGRLGTWALAGVGMGGILSFSLICFPIGLLGAVKILVSQSVGAGRPENAQPYLGAGIGIAVVMACLAIGIAHGALPLVPSFTATIESGSAAQTYLGIVAFSSLPSLVRIVVEQTRLAMGDSRSPMYVNLFANVCNVVLNYYLIFVLDLAVAGAAYATVIANVLGCVAMLAVQARDGIDFRRTRGHHVAGVFRLGLPSGLQFALELGAFAVMVVMLTNLSELDGAANQIAIQVIHFGFLPCVAIGEAASVMAGQAVGAGRRDLVHVVARQALLPSVGYATLMMVVFLLGGGWILVGFTSDPELLVLGRNLLYVAAAFQIADAINIVARSVLRGTGDVRYCARVGIVISWMMTPPSTWLLGYHYGLGALGGWLGLSLEIFAAAGLFWLRLNRNAWHEAADASLRELSPDGP